MANKTVRKEELVETLADTADEEAARAAVEAVIEKNGIDGGGAFSNDEAVSLLEAIANDDDTPTMVMVAANTAIPSYRLD